MALSHQAKRQLTPRTGKPPRSLSNDIYYGVVHEIALEVWLVSTAFGRWTYEQPRHVVVRNGAEYACDCGVAARDLWCAHLVLMWKLKIQNRTKDELEQLAMFEWQETWIEFESTTKAVRRG